jgi:hypothetical protein
MSETGIGCEKDQPEIAQGKARHPQNTKPIDVRQLKRARSSAKGTLSKRQNELLDLISNAGSSPDLQKKLIELDRALEKFKTSHSAFHDNLRDEDDILESIDYYDAVIERVSDLKERAMQAIDWGHGNDEPDIHPEDSVSNAGSKSCSRATSSSNLSKQSTSSSVSASRAKASAKKAALEAQSALLAKRQALQEEKLRIQHMSDQLELETELAKANAEEQAYLEAEKDENPTSLPKSDEARNEQIQISPTKQRTKHFPGTSKSTLPPSPERESNHLEMDLQGTANTMERMLLQKQRHTLALMLPQPEVPTFDRDPIEYQNFIRIFETLIKFKTDSDSTRLYYLIYSILRATSEN